MSCLLLGMTLWGSTILSVPSITIDSRSSTADAIGISDEAGTPLQGNGTVTSDLVQIIDVGNDDTINGPNMTNLDLTGDDTLLATVNIGWGFPSSPDAGLFSKTVDVDTGKTIYIRVWNGFGTTDATYYGESVAYSVGSAAVQTFFAGTFATTKDRDLTVPDAVPTFSAEASVRAIELSWQSSTTSDNAGTLVVRSDSTITWTPDNYKDYLDTLDFSDYAALIITPGIKLMTTGTGTSASDTGLTADQTYYYAAFAYDDVYNYASAVTTTAVPTSGLSIEGAVPFTYFQSIPGDTSVELSWGVSDNITGYNTLEIWRVSANSESTANYPTEPTTPATLVTTANFVNGSYTDSSLLNHRYYYYAIFARQDSGTYSQPATTLTRPQTSGSYKAYNYPNPFAPGSGETTTLVFPLDSAGTYRLLLLNMVGEMVWETSGSGTDGANTILWNGQNEWGHIVPNGVYVLRVVKDGKVVASGKVSVLD